jgi:hypothetical protein
MYVASSAKDNNDAVIDTSMTLVYHSLSLDNKVRTFLNDNALADIGNIS